MAKNTTVFYTKDVRFVPTVFNTSDSTIAKTIFTPATEGSRLDMIAIASTSGTQRIVQLQVNNAGTISPLGTVTVPSNAGTNGSVAIVSGLNRTNLPYLKIDANGNPYLNLPNGSFLEARMLASLPGVETIGITVGASDYNL